MFGYLKYGLGRCETLRSSDAYKVSVNVYSVSQTTQLPNCIISHVVIETT
jgi:hypothetical protein